MTALLERWTSSAPEPVGERSISFSEYVQLVTSWSVGGMSYSSSITADSGGNLEDMVETVHRQNNVVSAAVVTRGLLLKQLRFAWRNVVRSDPNYRQLFGDESLSLLERPDPEAMTTPQWLATMEFHESYTGSAFTVNRGGRLEVLDPDLVDVAILGVDDPDAVVSRRAGRKAGYVHWPQGRDSEVSEAFKLSEVMHWTPEPNPVKWWTGSSWVLSVLPEITTDKAATKFLNAFLDNAATPNMIIRPHESLTPDKVDEYREIFTRETRGLNKAGRTMWLGGGSEAQVVGSSIADLDLRNVTGGGETRIALRSRIPAAILGVRESLSGSSLNASSYNSARRMLADGWFTPTVIDLCRSAETLVPAPAGAELWYDPADVLFTQEDSEQTAAILNAQASAIRQLVDGGFDPATAVTAVRDGNLTALKHSGLTSVQLLPPGTTGDTTDE